MKEIVKGHLKELVNSSQELRDKRMEICNACPLITATVLGVVCDKTKEIKTAAGTVKGCGCRLEAKTRLKGERCPAGKW